MALTNSLYNALPKLSNIQGFWRMEEESGTRADLSNNANTLQDNNTVLYAAGKIGNAADFEKDTSEYLSITDAAQTGLDITGEISILCWVKPEIVDSSRRVIIGKWKETTNRCYLLFIHESDVFSGRVTSDGATAVSAVSATTPIAGTWYHVGFTLNQVTDLIQVYVNGLADGDPVAFTNNIADKTSADFFIGCEGTPTWYLDSLVDEAIVWNTCLTAGEVLKVYNINTLAKYKKIGGAFLLNFI